MVEMVGQKMTVAANGHALASATDSRLSRGAVGLLVIGQKGYGEARFRNVRLYSIEKVEEAYIIPAAPRYPAGYDDEGVKFVIEKVTVPSTAKAPPPAEKRRVAEPPVSAQRPPDIRTYLEGIVRDAGMTDLTADLREGMIGALLNLRNATFDGDVDLRGATVTSEVGAQSSTFNANLIMASLVVGKELILADSSFQGNVTLESAKVGLSVFANRTTFEKTLSLNSATIGVTLHLNNATFDGDVDLRGATVTSQINAIASNFHGTLKMGGVVVNHGILMSESTFSADVDLDSAEVHQSVFANNASFEGDLDMYGLVVGNEIEMSGSTFSGDVYMNYAKVDGSITATGGKFMKEFILNDTTIDRDLLLHKGAIFNGNVSLNFSKVAADTVISGATFTEGVTAIGASFGTLTLGHEDSPSRWGEAALLDLTAAHAIMVHDYFSPNEKNELKSWPSRLALAGFAYEKLGSLTSEKAGDMLERSTDWFDEWLMRSQGFSAQPYWQLSGMLRQSGFPEKADDVLYSARIRERNQAWHHCEAMRWSFMIVMEWVIGYGVGLRTFRVFWWIILFTLIGFCVLLGWSRKREDVFTFAYASFIHTLPIIQLDKHKTIITLDNLPRPAFAWFVAQRISGWMLGGFLVAALAGLTQKS